MLSFRVARAGALSLVVLSVMTACSSNSARRAAVKRTAAQQELEAAFLKAKSTSGRITGTVALDPRHRAPISGRWSGDLEHGRGALTAHFVVDGLAPVAVELRWLDGTLYTRRAIVSADSRTKARAISFLVRGAAEKPWLKLSTTNAYAAAFGQAFAPATLLTHLRNRAAAFTVERGERIAGRSVTHLTSQATLPVIGLWIPSSVDLWTDSTHRLVRVAVMAPNGGVSYDVSDYGTAVSVTAPAATDVATSNEPASPDLTEPYTIVKSGASNGVTWALETARTTDGRECWLWKATPGITQVISDRPDGARCIVPADLSGDVTDRVQFVVADNGAGPYSVLGVLLPSNATLLKLGLIGGKLQAIPVVSPVVWVGPTSPHPAYLGVQLADGSSLSCGAGAVSSPSDLVDLSADAVQRLVRSPWACVTSS